MAMIEEGLVPLPLAEGMYTNRLKYIAVTCRNAVSSGCLTRPIMAHAKKILGKVSCIAATCPYPRLNRYCGTVKEYCRKLIETCAPGGGFI